RADVHRAVIDLREELLVGRRPPAAFLRRPVELLLVEGPLGRDGLLVRLADVPERVQTDRQLWLAELLERALVELDVLRKSLGPAADDRQHQRKAVARRAQDRVG